jgi:GH15 family glucan-1,4-alpha-glucosidase
MAQQATPGFEKRETPKAPPSVATPSRLLIEDHGLIGDLQTAALVARDGTIDFLCLPDFDSDACFASLLGTPENGRWKMAPVSPVKASRRRYRPDTLILETEFETAEGLVRLVDFMPIRSETPCLVRFVEGLRGEIRMKSDLVPRFANGYTIPHVYPKDGATAAIAGPDGLYLRVGGQRQPEFSSEFTIKAGQSLSFVLSWARPYEPIPAPIDAAAALGKTQEYWENWTAKLRLPKLGYGDIVKRSLITLKACTFAPSGAIVAAPTFGLPETLGGERNWDYRYCWIRDATLTLRAFIRSGASEEAVQFFKWLIDAIGGAPSQMQIMYGIRGERRLTEVELDWLSGYEGARPVRIGNAAYDQFQLDVFGEFAATIYDGVCYLGDFRPRAREVMKTIATAVSRLWTTQDRGIWEVRGPARSFTASKVAAWAAIDVWVRLVQEYGVDEPLQPWIDLRQQIFDEVCTNGYDPERNTFTQYYGSKALDASLLVIPLSGFLPPDDPRVVGTVKAIEQELMPKGLVLRYLTDETADGLSGEEGTFLPCSFWLVNTYQLLGRREDAKRLFERLIGLCNDLGLLAEEYLPDEHRQVGNFPQAFSHLALVQSAYFLSDENDVKRPSTHGKTASPI